MLVTRSREQAGELVDLLEAQGAEAVEAPLINIVAARGLRAARRGVRARRRVRLDRVHERQRRRARSWIGCCRARATCARWPAPGCAPSARHGVAADALRAEGRSRCRTTTAPTAWSPRSKATGALKGKRVLFPKADIARDTLPEELRAAGAEVTEVVAYRTVTAESDAHLGIYRQLLDRRIDVVTFSSASAVRAFVSIYGADQAVDLLNHTIVATIGPVTADAAIRYGITPQITPATSTVPALVDGARRHFQRGTKSTIEGRQPHDHEGRAHGAVAVAGDELRRGCGARRRCARSCARRVCRPTSSSCRCSSATATSVRREVSSMPGVFQLSVDEAVAEAQAAWADGIAGGAALRLAGRERRRRNGARTIRRPGARQPSARFAMPCRRWSSSPTSACANTRRTVTAGSSSTATSPTTPPSNSWCARRSPTPRPARTSSRRRT